MVAPSPMSMGGASDIAARIGAGGFGHRIESREGIAQARGERLGGEARGFGELRHLIERFAKGEQIARAGAADHDFGEQAFDIEHGRELLAQFGAQDGFAREVAHGIEARFDFVAIERRAQQALAQQASAHAGGGLIEDARSAWRRHRRKSARRVRDCAR